VRNRVKSIVVLVAVAVLSAGVQRADFPIVEDGTTRSSSRLGHRVRRTDLVGRRGHPGRLHPRLPDDLALAALHRPAFIYTLRDRNTGSGSDHDTLGVYRSDWIPKPAVGVIQSLA